MVPLIDNQEIVFFVVVAHIYFPKSQFYHCALLYV